MTKQNQNNGNQWVYYGLATAASVGLLWGGITLKKYFTKPPAEQAALQLALSVAKPYKTSVKRYLSAVGQCTASERLTLTPQVEGELMNIAYKNGGLVKKGTCLFEIDSRNFNAYLKQAEAQLESDRAQLALNLSQLKRSEALKSGDFVSQQEYDTYKTNVDIYQARVKSDEAACVLKSVDLEHCSLVAPFDGELSKSALDNHSFVNKGATLATLNQMQPIYVDCDLSECYLPDLLKARREHPDVIHVEAGLIDNATVKQRGDLIYVDNSIDKATGSFSIRASFKNEQYGFWDGNAVDVKIYYEQLNNILMVPEAALNVGNKGHFVYLVNGKGEAEMRDVEIGQTYQSWVVVFKGLQGDEQVIAAGHPLLAPGSKVAVAGTVEAPKLEQH